MSDSEHEELHDQNPEVEEVKDNKKRKERTRGVKRKQKTKQKEEEAPAHEVTASGSKIFSLFMSGLPYECNEEQIRTFFGNPESIVNITLPKYQDTGRCIGYAHVEFDRKNDYENGLSKHKQQIGGRYIDISPSKGKDSKKVVLSKDPPEDCRTIYIGNLPYDVTEDQVGDRFRKFGEIDQVRFAYNHVNKNFKGNDFAISKYFRFRIHRL